MSKLVFHFASMNAGKTARLLQVAYQYTATGNKVVCLLPDIDSRFGEEKGMIKSRMGMEREATIIRQDDNILDLIENISQYDVVLVDEVQFLSPVQIQQLAAIVDEHDVPVLAYGLTKDYMGNLFAGSQAMFELADTYKEIEGVCSCSGCTRRSTHTLKLDSNNKVVRNGVQVEIGHEDTYHAVCRQHWVKGEFK
jgi:thymidine kinase